VTDDLTPARFGTAFKAFMGAVVAAAVPPSSPLLERIQAHLGPDLANLPVIAEEFATYDHPNVQVALDAYLAEPGRLAQRLLGFHPAHDSAEAVAAGPSHPMPPTGFPRF
jgi:hypothetical protein